MDTKTPQFEEDDYGANDVSASPKKPTGAITLIFRGIIGLFVIGGMLYLSGLYQALQYRTTPPEVNQYTLSSMLDAEKLTIPLTVFVIRSELAGSRRSEKSISSVLENSKNIWAQADAYLDIQNIHTLTFTDDDIFNFFKNPWNVIPQIPEYDPNTINVLLFGKLGGINGIAFPAISSVAVADYTSVFDFRVLAHEIGHVLDLNHVPQDRGRLMFQGANGTTLSLDEIMRSRETIKSFFVQ